MKPWLIAWRTLLRRPGYTLTAVLMLVLGIGATSTLFSLIDTILLKPLPYPNSGRLVSVMESSPSKSSPTSLIAPVRLEDWDRLNQTFDGIAALYAENVTDTSGAEPERLEGRRVSPRYFDVYAAAPFMGRTFTKQEDLAGGPTSAVISYSFWTRRYARDPDVLGKRLVIGGKGYSIVGVMPNGFTAPTVDLWLPAQINAQLMQIRQARFYSGVGRMRPGITVQQAQADLARVQQRLGEQYPQSDKGWSALVEDLKESRVGDYRLTLLLVFGAVGLLLLIAIANIAGLTLAQLHQREREMAIRSSVGASRGQVIAKVMREVLLLAIIGAILGGIVGAAGVQLMTKIFATLPRIAELQFDWRALAFTALASLAAAIVFGLIPAMQSTRSDLARLLGESSRSVAGGRRVMQSGLVVAQLALTVMLLAGAGLLLRSYYNLSHVDVGFDSAHVLTFHVGASWDEDRPRIGRLQETLVSELQRQPGVESAGISSFLPANGATLNFQIMLQGLGVGGDTTATSGVRSVSTGFLQALHIPLVSGEWCPTLKMDFNAPLKVMVNRRFVDQIAKGENVIGRHVIMNQGGDRHEIIGVIGDAREDGPAAAPSPYLYVCMSAGAWPDPDYVVRTQGDPRALAANIRQIVHDHDPKRAVFGVKMLDGVLDDALEQPRLNAGFLGLFAASAMLLASVGLYSLISLVVTARTREIGVRIALGASASQIMQLIFSGAGKMLGAGIVLGLILTILAERAIKSVLFGVGPLDIATLAAAVAVLVIVSALAAFVPARRAAGTDPLNAMRTD